MTSGPVLRGLRSGAAVATCGSLLYGLCWVGWTAADSVSAHGNPVTPIVPRDSVGAFLFLLGVVAVIGMVPAIVAGALTGAAVGGALGAARRPGPVLGWFVGTVLAYLVALAVNVPILRSNLDSPWQFEEWLQWLGLPSILFVVGFGVVGVRLSGAQETPSRAASTASHRPR